MTRSRINDLPARFIGTPTQGVTRRPIVAPARPAVTHLPSIPVQKARAKPRMLLVDLDNVLCVPNRCLHQMLAAIVAAAGSCDQIVAAGNEITLRRVAEACAQVGIVPVQAAPGKNSADLLLLQAGKDAAKAGVHDFVIASGDHIFANLAQWGAVRVVMPGSRPVSKRLSNAARAVHMVALPAA